MEKIGGGHRQSGTVVQSLVQNAGSSSCEEFDNSSHHSGNMNGSNAMDMLYRLLNASLSKRFGRDFNDAGVEFERNGVFIGPFLWKMYVNTIFNGVTKHRFGKM